MSLAAQLGRLGAPSRHGEQEHIRLALVDRLVSPSPLGGEAWVAAWREASTTLADEVLDRAAAALLSAARYSRMPKAALAKVLPDAAGRAQLIERFMAEGIELERLEGLAPSEGTDRARGAALQAAWDRSQELSQREHARWHRAAAGVRHWRRSWRPLLITAAVLLPLAMLLAAWLGGWLPAPAWFDPIGAAFWSLPWP